jgi:hypothetical protein
MNNNNNLDELVSLFDYDLEVLELVNTLNIHDPDLDVLTTFNGNINNLEEVVYHFDTEVLELVNSVASITKEDEDGGFWYSQGEGQLTYEGITFWDMSKVYVLDCLFMGNRNFNELLLWNTKHVERFNCIFQGATSYNQPIYWHWNPREWIESVDAFLGADSLEEKNKPELYDVRLAENDYWLAHRCANKFGDINLCIKERPLENLNERINRINRFGGINDFE